MALLAVIRNGLAVNRSLPQCVLHWRKTNSSSLNNTVKYIYTSSVRNVDEHHFKLTPKASAKKQRSDDVPAAYNLIYQSPMETYLKFGYPAMFIGTIGFSGFLLLYFYGKVTPSPDNSTNKKKTMVFLNAHNELFIYIGAMYLFAAAVFSIFFKVPFRIYKHKMEANYIAIFLNPIPTKVHHFHFKTAKQTVFMNPIYLVFKDCHYVIDKRKAILFDYHFRTPADYFDMLGMD